MRKKASPNQRPPFMGQFLLTNGERGQESRDSCFSFDRHRFTCSRNIHRFEWRRYGLILVHED